MARRLILDTGVVVSLERSRGSILEFVDDGDDIAISIISVAELQVGVELASASQRESRAAFLKNVLETLPVEPYDLAAALAHANLLAHVHRAGRQRGAHDLIIAATAVVTDRMILTTDRRARFDSLPGVQSVIV